MNGGNKPYEIFALGDGALTIDWGNHMDEQINREVTARAAQFRQQPFPGFSETVPAYSSLTVFFDPLFIRQHISPGKTAMEYVMERVQALLDLPVAVKQETGRLVRIPVCYDPTLAPELEWLAREKEISVEELVILHTTPVYRVYMLGFLPGFAYMGEVDERIRIPRKPQPQPTRAGSVGIAGKQTGIYPFASPGGWTVIGNSPVQLFNKNRKEPTLIRAGDRVQFFAIDKYEFAHY